MKISITVPVGLVYARETHEDETDPVVKITHYAVWNPPMRTQLKWVLDYTPYQIMPQNVFALFYFLGFPDRSVMALWRLSDGVGCVTDQQLEALYTARRGLSHGV